MLNKYLWNTKHAINQIQYLKCEPKHECHPQDHSNYGCNILMKGFYIRTHIGITLKK